MTTLAGASPVRTNLPLALTSFVGRRSEIDTVTRLLSQSRLVTLIGTGGIGKTRLALEVARRSLGRYADGAWMVELASLFTPELVPHKLLTALAPGTLPGRSALDTLVKTLETRELLCVLDNCEHLLRPCGAAVDALLRACPGLRILATSREVLGLSYETIWRVPSMTIRGSGQPTTPDELRAHDAVQLFVQRVRRRGRDLTSATRQHPPQLGSAHPHRGESILGRPCTAGQC